VNSFLDVLVIDIYYLISEISDSLGQFNLFINGTLEIVCLISQTDNHSFENELTFTLNSYFLFICKLTSAISWPEKYFIQKAELLLLGFLLMFRFSQFIFMFFLMCGFIMVANFFFVIFFTSGISIFNPSSGLFICI